MARPKSPDGKRVPMSTRFSEPEAAAIDAARGNTDRSVWLREVALAAARSSGRKPLPTDVITITADDRMPPGTAALVSRGKVTAFNIGATPEPARKSAACPHRLPVGAYCKTCGRTKT